MVYGRSGPVGAGPRTMHAGAGPCMVGAVDLLTIFHLDGGPGLWPGLVLGALLGALKGRYWGPITVLFGAYSGLIAGPIAICRGPDKPHGRGPSMGRGAVDKNREKGGAC